jgi:hypothetical protein
LPRDALEQRLERRVVEDAPAVERIDEHLGISGAEHAHEEMPRKRDTLRANARAPRDLAVHERERNRDARFPIEHVGEEAVSRVVVVALVPREAERRVEVLRERLRRVVRVQRVEPRVRERRRELVEAREELAHVERRVGVTRDQRRAERDVDGVARGERLPSRHDHAFERIFGTPQCDKRASPSWRRLASEKASRSSAT